MADRYDCQAITDIYTLRPPNRTWRIMMALNRAVINCRLPLQTVGKGDIQQYLINPDTMSTFIRDTLVYCVEPPPFRWTDIILEQIANTGTGTGVLTTPQTNANCLIMQSI